MAIQFTTETMRDGQHCTATMTFKLVPLGNKDEIVKVADETYRNVSFAEHMRRATKPYIFFSNDEFPEGVTVSFKDILRAYPSIDLERSKLRVSTSVRPMKK
ncbi:MAG TPA: hypothetical protein PLQ56_06790 [Aggregatilineales bacterium]|nr:hypothetical protein [Aggregatilineales bacterium]